MRFTSILQHNKDHILQDNDREDIESVGMDFLKNLNSGSFQGPFGSIQLWVVKASQLPRSDECASSNRSKKVTKACWRIQEAKCPVGVGYEKMNNKEPESTEVKC